VSHLRPGIAAWLRQRAEPRAVAAATAALGWFALSEWRRGEAILALIVGAAALLLAALLPASYRRSRLGRPPEGPGLVTVRERRIAYFGPVTGGFIDLEAIVRIELVTAPGRRESVWRLRTADGDSLDVPEAAEGSAALFDALAPLPGIDWEAVLAALERPRPGILRVWERQD
jgi:hypothetical protein